RAARNHHVRITAADDFESIAHRVRTAGAGRTSCLVRTLRAVTDADVPGGEVYDGCGDKKRRDFSRAALQQVVVLALDDVESADPGSNVHAHARAVLDLHVEPGIAHRFVRGGHRQVDKAAHLARFLLLDEIKRIEALNLGGNLGIEQGGIEVGD